MLSVQQIVPEFTNVSTVLPAESDYGSPITGTINLSDFVTFDGDSRTGWLVLVFYPLDFAFQYPSEIYEFNSKWDEFLSLDCRILAVSCDSVYAQIAWCNSMKADNSLDTFRIPIVADFDKSIAKSFGVLLPNGNPRRATFLISPN
eukprot:gene30738-40876_t